MATKLKGNITEFIAEIFPFEMENRMNASTSMYDFESSAQCIHTYTNTRIRIVPVKMCECLLVKLVCCFRLNSICFERCLCIQSILVHKECKLTQFYQDECRNGKRKKNDLLGARRSRGGKRPSGALVFAKKYYINIWFMLWNIAQCFIV